MRNLNTKRQSLSASHKLIIAVLATVLGLALLPLIVGAQPADAQGDEATITILHNNDGESKLLADEEGGFPGISRFVATMEGLIADAGDPVVLTSGDNFLASKEFSASINAGPPFYDATAVNGLYDAMALGNHDFDFGPDVAADFVSSFDPPIPFLSANIDASGEPSLQALVDDGLVAASTVVMAGGVEVGVIGAITPRLPNISSPRGVTVSADVAGAIAAEVAALEGAGVDKIILISHLQGLSEDKELVPQLAGVDVVIAGGGDELLKNSGDSCLPDDDAADAYPIVLQDSTGADVPVVTGPGGYRCIGHLEVTFEGGTAVGWSGQSVGVPLDGEQNAGVLSEVEEPIAAAVSGLASNVLGTSEVDLDGQRSSVRTMSSNEGSLLADALLSSGQALASDFGAPTPAIAIQNGGGIRNDAVIPAGDFTEADTFDIAPFSNFVVVTEVPRQRLLELLENAVAAHPEAEGFFPQLAGFTMSFDSSATGREINRDGECELTGDAGSRIVDVTLDDGTRIVENGQVVSGPDVALATIDFLARGGDCYPLGDLGFTRLGVSYQKALADYVSGPLGGTISASDYSASAASRITAGERTESTSGGSGGASGGGGELPATGQTTGPVVLGATLMILMGAIAVTEARRMRVAARQ